MLNLKEPSEDVKTNSDIRIPDIYIQLHKRGLANGGAYLKFVDDLLEYRVDRQVIDQFFGHNIDFAYTRNGGLLLRVVSTTGYSETKNQQKFIFNFKIYRR